MGYAWVDAMSAVERHPPVMGPSRLDHRRDEPRSPLSHRPTRELRGPEVDMPQLSPVAVAALRHGDRALFVGFALALVATTGAALTDPPERAEAEDVLAKAQKISEFVHTAETVPPPAPPGWSDALRERLSPDRVPQVDPTPAWLFHRRPNVLHQRPPEEPAPEWVHTAAHGVSATSPSPGRVSVRWTAPKGDLVVVTQRLERRLAGGAWTEVVTPATLLIAAHDDQVPPRSRVEYRVVSTAAPDLDNVALTEAGRRGASLELPAALVRLESEPSAALDVARDRFAVVRATSPVPLHPEQGSAQLVVHVWGEKGFEAVNLLAKVGARLTREERDLGGVLEEVGEEPRLVGGVTRRVAWARLRWDDGAVEEVTDKDAPPELQKKK